MLKGCIPANCPGRKCCGFDGRAVEIDLNDNRRFNAYYKGRALQHATYLAVFLKAFKRIKQGKGKIFRRDFF